MADPQIPLTVPSTPDAATVVQVAAALRILFSTLAGVGILGSVWAQFSDAQLNTLATIVLMLGSAALSVGMGIWGWWQHRRAAAAAHEGAIASAIASSSATMASGTPVAIPLRLLRP